MISDFNEIYNEFKNSRRFVSNNKKISLKEQKIHTKISKIKQQILFNMENMNKISALYKNINVLMEIYIDELFECNKQHLQYIDDLNICELDFGDLVIFCNNLNDAYKIYALNTDKITQIVYDGTIPEKYYTNCCIFLFSAVKIKSELRNLLDQIMMLI